MREGEGENENDGFGIKPRTSGTYCTTKLYPQVMITYFGNMIFKGKLGFRNVSKVRVTTEALLLRLYHIVIFTCTKPYSCAIMTHWRLSNL